jgi:hypothetical protein
MTTWIQQHAMVVGDTVPIRFRRQISASGVTKLQYTKKDYLLLPSYYTWAMLHQGFIDWATGEGLMVKDPPSLSSFRRVVHEDCPTIKIRSPRDNVCDDCVIYRNSIGSNPSVADMEGLASHVRDARSMRHEYTKDCTAASATHAVTTIDFAQNVAMPHSAQTPSMWYFLSLINVSVFGIYNQPDEKQWNFIYTERKAAKGSNEVISMLDAFARMRSIYGERAASEKTWTIYADNCGGQNKNNNVVKFLLFLTHCKAVKSVTLKFLVKGHTKNHCDRGFANMKRHYAKIDLWTLPMLVRSIEESATTNKCVLLEDNDTIFRDFKAPLVDMYKDLNAIQRYQIFSMDADAPGVVYCRKRPSSAPVEQNLLRAGTRAELSPEQVAAFWASVQPATPPATNKEKVVDIYKKVLPYVPLALRSDSLYIVPDAADTEAVRATKRARRRKTTPRLTPASSAARYKQF